MYIIYTFVITILESTMIIFKGKDLILHHHKGKSDYIIISFRPGYEFNTALDDFFLLPVVKKYDINFLGINAFWNHYYLTSEMNKVIELCNRISKQFKKIIVMGLSLAGYAALKYSKALNADIVFAMSPRATLDKQVCPLSHMSEDAVTKLPYTTVKKSTIQASDIKGKVFLVFDPYVPKEDLDKEHLGYLRKQIGECVNIPTYFAGHMLITHLQGSVVFKSIIDALVSNNKQKVISTVADVRRHHIENIKVKAALFIDKYPYLVYRMLTSQSFLQVQNNQKILNDYRLLLKLSFNLAKKGYQQESANFLRSILFAKTGNFDVSNTTPQQQSCLTPYPYLINFHGYFLAYNYQTKQLEPAANLDEKPYCLPVQIYNQNGKMKLICIHLGFIFELKYQDKVSYHLDLLSDDYTPNHIKPILIGNVMFIHTIERNRFIGVHQGNIHIASRPQDWESFAPISMVSPTQIAKQNSISVNVNNQNITISVN
ncbi:Tetratricopeptide (TPR) repeat (TPR) (PDB:3AS4) [Commensalibacter communis]|nr:Tetratricopeptide (TPR) repeat (TPR) (PDB:3AS4) [Commensalibacter communis]